jgi:glycerol-3-phosphate cytidylyltransferase
MKIITFGTYDLFHIGHVNILKRAREMGNELIVGVSSDELNYSKKGHYPIFSQDERMEIVRSLKFVDDVFVEISLEKKLDYIIEHDANVLVMGDDWEGRFDFCKIACKVIYLPRTPVISTTNIKAEIFSRRKIV